MTLLRATVQHQTYGACRDHPTALAMPSPSKSNTTWLVATEPQRGFRRFHGFHGVHGQRLGGLVGGDLGWCLGYLRKWGHHGHRGCSPPESVTSHTGTVPGLRRPNAPGAVRHWSPSVFVAGLGDYALHLTTHCLTSSKISAPRAPRSNHNIFDRMGLMSISHFNRKMMIS